MIVTLLGGAGAGKTTIAKAMEKYVKDSFVIDGDELRAETANMDIGVNGREVNMHLGFSRARRLSDLGFTVFMAMQAPIKEIRDQYLTKHDVEILVINNGDNPKDAKGYNKNFDPDYSGVNKTQILQEFSEDSFYDLVFPKVLVPARFQGFHKGHKVVLEEAKRLSPNDTVGLRVDGGDIIAKTNRLQGADINFDISSVGATGNTIMAAVLAKGESKIQNAAIEPEITNLCEFLVDMGARIEGVGTSTLLIDGVDELHATEGEIIGDRIEAGTLLIAGALTKAKLKSNMQTFCILMQYYLSLKIAVLR